MAIKGVYMEGSSWVDLRRLWEEERDARLNESDSQCVEVGWVGSGENEAFELTLGTWRML